VCDQQVNSTADTTDTMVTIKDTEDTEIKDSADSVDSVVDDLEKDFNCPFYCTAPGLTIREIDAVFL